MKIILRESYESLGRTGDIISVKDGFARNFLVPKGIAYPANHYYRRLFDQEREELLRRDALARAQAEDVAGRAVNIRVQFNVKLGDRGIMHGAITNSDIAAKLAEIGIEVDRRKIALPEPIKTTGEHIVRVKLHADVGFNVQVAIIPEAPPSEEGIEEEVTGAAAGAAAVMAEAMVATAEATTAAEMAEAAEIGATASTTAVSKVEIVEMVQVSKEEEAKDDLFMSTGETSGETSKMIDLVKAPKKPKKKEKFGKKETNE